jgi:hypothetical protein
MHQPCDIKNPTATVTIARNTPHGQCDLTVMCAAHPEGWEISVVLDEEGNHLTLTKTEELLVISLVEAGVDETGR